MENLAVAFLTPILTGLIVWAIERHRMKEEADRQEIEQVNREVNNATMELSYATSIAVTDGKKNGELKRAREAYDKAVKHRNELGQKLMMNKR